MNANSKPCLIVGDIHGCYLEFLDLLKKADYHKSKHRLILLGDIINRGPHSFKMLEWAKNEGIELIQGNHERGFVRAVKNDMALGPCLTGLKKELGPRLHEWIEWIESWPYYLEDEDFLVVHGGLVPGQHPRETDPWLLTCIRTWDGTGQDISSETNPPWYDFYEGKKLVIYGHWAAQGLNVRSNTIGMDSGCVYGRQLSGILLPQKQILQVPAHKQYVSF